MGVHGLWTLLSSCGHPVSLEQMRGKVLAVDVSVWLHQTAKGFRDKRGQPLLNAHILGLFHRIIKLMSYQIKPIFVFDGGIPSLKRKTILNRMKKQASAKSDADKYTKELLSNLVEHDALGLSKPRCSSYSKSLLAKHRPEEEDIFKLPPVVPLDNEEKTDNTLTAESLSNSSRSEDSTEYGDIHIVDLEGESFRYLAKTEQLEVLSDLIETRKQNSWKLLSKMPQESEKFSAFQMERLLKRRQVQCKLEHVRQEIGKEDNKDDESLSTLKDKMAQYSTVINQKLASDDQKHFVLLKDRKNILGKQTDNTKENENSTPNSTMDLSEKEMGELSSCIHSTHYSSDMAHTDLNEDKVFNDQLKSNEVVPLGDTDEPSQEEILAIINSEGAFQHDSKRNNNSEDDIIDESEPNDFSPVENFPEHEILNPHKKYFEFPIEDHSDTGESDHSFEDVPFDEVKENDEFDYHQASPMVSSMASIDCGITSENELQRLEVPIKRTYISSDNVDTSENVVTARLRACVNDAPVISSPIIDALKANRTSPPQEGYSQVGLESLKENSTSSQFHHTSDNNIDKYPVKDFSNILKKGMEFYSHGQATEKRLARSERLAQNITEKMQNDVQELLTLFGVPYVIAPMEAESQCAFFEMNGVTEGTITDDSDIWLFGGSTVYKNFFNQNHEILKYELSEITARFKNQLCREKMVCIAMFTGSDYTEGIRSVGPVTAMELLSEFPGTCLESLTLLSKWWRKHHLSSSDESLTPVKKKLKKLDLPLRFPSLAVVDSYLHPEVNKSLAAFSWGNIDAEGLCELAKVKLGWEHTKTMQLLNPILNKKGSQNYQSLISAHFVKLDSSSKHVSKRIQRLLNVGTSEGYSGQPACAVGQVAELSINKKKKSNISITSSAREKLNQERKRRAVAILKKTSVKGKNVKQRRCVNVCLSESSDSS